MSSCTLQQLESLLQQHFQLTSFRGGQHDAIRATLNGQDSLVILPTGAGKSLAFQFPPFTRPHAFTIVISPLLALAKDQVEQACERGIDARIWNSEVTEPQRLAVIRELCNAEVEMKLLYVTPESLRQPRLRDALKEAHDLGTLLGFAVDEAHCISQWGHDFRPSYLELSTLKQDFPTIPIACLTASCTARVQSSIVEILGLKDVRLVKASFNRPNIHYQVTYKDLVADGSEEAVMQDIIDYVKSHPGQSGIIYARLRTTCDSIGKALECEDLDVAVYHAGKDARQRNRVHSDWSSGAIQVVVATVAFGMGIDKPDVRWVIHFNAPASMEGFYQESGRAGRDGQPCTSLVYASHSDLEEMAKLERGNRSGSVTEVSNLIMSGLCRRKKLLAFFGESRAACTQGTGEQACDFCRDPGGVAKALGQLGKAQERRSIAAGVRACMAQRREAAEGSSEAPSKRPLSTWSTAKEVERVQQGGLAQAAPAAAAVAAAAAAAAEAPLNSDPSPPVQGGARQLLRPSLRSLSGVKRAPDQEDPVGPELQQEDGAGTGAQSEEGMLMPLAGAVPAPGRQLVRPGGLLRPLMRRRAAGGVQPSCPGQEDSFKQNVPEQQRVPAAGSMECEDASARGGLVSWPAEDPGDGSQWAEDEENAPPVCQGQQLGLGVGVGLAAAAPRGISIGLKAPRRPKRSFEPPLKGGAGQKLV